MADKKIELEFKATSKGNGLRDAAQDAQNLGSSVRDLRKELDRSEQAFEKSKSLAISLKTQYKNLRMSGEGTREMFQALSQQISAAEAKELDAITATRKLAKEIDGVGDETIATSAELQDLNKRLQESEGYITGVGGKAALQAQKMDELRASTDRAGDELGQLGGKADEANSSLHRVAGGVDEAKSSLSKIEKQVGTTAYAMGNILADGLRDAAQAAVEFGKQSYESFRAFDDEARRTFAQMPGMSAEMRESLTGDAKVIAAQIGRLPDEVLPAMRKAMNLGISENNLFTSIETASLAARISGESLVDTMVLGQSVVNAYGGELYTLSESYDYLNFITQSSNLEFGDLNANMSGIISAAAEAGIGLDSVAGAMITMNRQGDSATEIGELLSNVLTQISIEGTALGSSFKAAAGVGFREFTAAGGTLAEGLQILDDYAKETGQDLLNMVGGSSSFFRDVQAARGVLELTGKHADELAQNIDGATKSAGSLNKAAAEFEDGPALAYDKAAAGVANLKLAFGELIAVFLQSRGYIDGLNTSLSLLSGTLEHQIDQQTSGMIESARATGDYAEAIKTLNSGVAAAGPIDFGLTDGLTADTEILVREMARVSGSYEEFQASLAASGANIFGNTANVSDWAFNIGQLYEEEKVQGVKDYYQALSEVNYWQSEIAKGAIQAGNAVQQFYADQAAGLHQQAKEVKDLHEVMNVLDGDTVTIELQGELKDIRFRNVNAPEIEHEDAAAMPWAYEAMKKTQAYFDNNPLNLQGEMDRESFGRIIAAVPDIERDLVAAGMAIPLPISLTEDPETFAELEAITKRAAAAGLGMFEDQALAARVLSGEMVDLNVYYEELATHQAALTGYFSEATGPVSALFEAYQGLATAPASGIAKAKDAVLAGNAAIVESYQTTAYEIYLAQNGATESTVAMGVAMGIFTEQEGLARLEFANTQTAIEELITSQDELRLTDEELIVATSLLIEGFAGTPEQAANAAKGIDTVNAAGAGARDTMREVREALISAQGDYTATFTTTNTTINKTYNKTYNETTDTKGGSSGGVGDSKKQYSGGPMWPGQSYLVGDTASGNPTPYSEIIVPQQPMMNLGVQGSKGMLGGGQAASIQVTNHFYMNAENANLDKLFETQERSLFSAAQAMGITL